MKANELMVGDWYAFRGHPYKCTASDIASIAECEEKGAQTDISEIPLTPEILEKNGFEKQGFDGWLLDSNDLSWMILWRTDFPSPHLRIDSYSSQTGSFSSAVSYVHTLQHAIRLCGIEKEIEI